MGWFDENAPAQQDWFSQNAPADIPTLEPQVVTPDDQAGFFQDPGKYLWRQTPEAKSVAEGVRSILSGLVPQSFESAAEFATPVVGAVKDVSKAVDATRKVYQGEPIEQINREEYPEAYRYENFGQQPLKQQVETVGGDVVNVIMGGLIGKGLVHGAPPVAEGIKAMPPEPTLAERITQPRVEPAVPEVPQEPLAPVTPETPPVPDEVPLGLYRPVPEISHLSNLPEQHFDIEHRSASQALDAIERDFDNNPDHYTGGSPKQQAMAKAQDRYQAAQLERFRREIVNRHPGDLFKDFSDEAARLGDPETVDITTSEGAAKLKLMMDELKCQQPTDAELAGGWEHLRGTELASDPNFREVQGYKAQLARKWADKLSEPSAIATPPPPIGTPLKPKPLIGEPGTTAADVAAAQQPAAAPEMVTLHHATPRQFESFGPEHATPTGLGGNGVFFNTEPQTGAYGDNVISIQVPKEKLASHAQLEAAAQAHQDVSPDVAAQREGFAGIQGPAPGDYILYNPNEFLKPAEAPLPYTPESAAARAAQPQPVPPPVPPEYGGPPTEPVPGIANRYIQEQIKAGTLPEEALVSGTGTTKEASIAKARARLAKDPGEAFKAAQRVNANQMLPDDPALLHAYSDQLNEGAAQARKASMENPTDRQLRAAADAAEQANLHVLQNVLPKAKGQIQVGMVGFQGAVPADISTFAGMQKELQTFNGGKPLNPQQRVELYQREKTGQRLKAKERAGLDRMQKEIDRTLPRRRVPTREEMQASMQKFVERVTPCS